MFSFRKIFEKGTKDRPFMLHFYFASLKILYCRSIYFLNVWEWNFI